jgi:hypothetical protein
MPRHSRVVALVVLVLGTLLVLGGPAWAQATRPQSLHVLELDSDDADDQAEALTGALRSRARSAPGWVLLDTAQSLSMLTAALRCPQRPDQGCLQRIGDQLKTDRFVWGIVTKAGAGPHLVTAEVHEWMRGKPDVVAKESYSDNLKDQNDDTLRKIANRVFDRLTGGPASTLNIHAGSVDGMVIVDGEQKVALQHGSATVLVGAGAHLIEIQAAGFTPARQNVTANGGETQDVNVELAVEPPFAPATPASPRKTLIWGTLIGGGALLVAGGVLSVVFESERATLNTDLQNNYGFGNSIKSIPDPCTFNAAGASSAELGQINQGCSAHNTAQAVLIPQIASLAAGGILATVGIVLLVTDHKKDSTAGVTTGITDVRVLPDVGPRGGSLALTASF